MSADDKWALITGASSGIGKALAHAFAARDYNLLLVARNDLSLRQVTADCGAQFQVATEAYPADLSDLRAVDALIGRLSAAGRRFEILVNNAGFGVQGEFRSTTLERELELLNLQLATMLKLTKALLPGMVSRGSGRILNVASLYSFAPVPYQSVYAASKAFLMSFSVALAEELRGTGVTVTALCPGVTQTEFRARAGIGERSRGAGATAASVAETAARRTLKGDLLVVPGAVVNRFFVFMSRHLPVAVVPRLMRLINKRRGVNE